MCQISDLFFFLDNKIISYNYSKVLHFTTNIVEMLIHTSHLKCL